MKKKILFVLVTFLLINCQKVDKTEPNSMRATQDEAISILKKYSSQSKISIEHISYVEQGTATISYITYKLDGEIFNNLAIARGTGMIKLKNKLYSLLTGVTVKCVGKCTNSVGKCTIEGTYDPNTGTNTIECSCEGCIMEVSG